jgi:hypothetical protein
LASDNRAFSKENARIYQLDLTTPGISPREASSLKHILHIWNLRI